MKEDFTTEISLRQRCQNRVCSALMCGIMSFIWKHKWNVKILTDVSSTSECNKWFIPCRHYHKRSSWIPSNAWWTNLILSNDRNGWLKANSWPLWIWKCKRTYLNLYNREFILPIFNSLREPFPVKNTFLCCSGSNTGKQSRRISPDNWHKGMVQTPETE